MFFKNKNTTQAKPARNKSHHGGEVVTRNVNDRRWVPSSQLEIGMYVNELDKPWEQTRFLFQGFMIEDYETLKAVQAACERAFVQTVKVARIPSNSANRMVSG